MQIGTEKKYDGYYFDKVTDKRSSESTQHFHRGYEVYYMKSGRCDYFAGGRLFEVESGDIIIIPEGVIHKTNYRSPTHTRFLINFSGEYIEGALKEALPGEVTLYRSAALAERAELFFGLIEEEYAKEDAFVSLSLSSLTASLMLSLVRSENKRRVDFGKRRLVDEALIFVEENYMNDISLASAAKNSAVSPEHLSRAFKSETGFGFSEYLTLTRLTKAEYILKNEPGKAISEVAYAVGFNDSNYFSVKFKKAYGTAPSNIKKSD